MPNLSIEENCGRRAGKFATGKPGRLSYGIVPKRIPRGGYAGEERKKGKGKRQKEEGRRKKAYAVISRT